MAALAFAGTGGGAFLTFGGAAAVAAAAVAAAAVAAAVAAVSVLAVVFVGAFAFAPA